MSVTVPPKGSHGVPFPRFLVRLGSRFAPRMFRRRPNKTGGGIQTLLLETKGARSGKTRNAILGFLGEGPDAWLVIASLGGAARQPGWMYNLAKEPHATVEFYGGRRIDVEAHTLSGADFDAAWKRIANEAPEYAKYLEKTDRQIPVVRLTTR
ncbi:MAG TPA: nitroreductase/quinone reductase family protein [Candidatus Limnocylindria bacterium]|jgi:deazaflavin-dependent oxidoreductase (nitroreductase family)